MEQIKKDIEQIKKDVQYIKGMMEDFTLSLKQKPTEMNEQVAKIIPLLEQLPINAEYKKTIMAMFQTL